MKRSAILSAAALLLLLAAFAAKSLLVGLPGLPAQVPGEFDSRRAMDRLARILGDQRPHPVDSAANDSVRGRLIAELRALGLSPRVSDDFVCNASRKSRAVSCGRVRNVVATIGPPGGRHVLMASHYDSTPAGPGAADDGIGMAVMLETAALLRNRPPERPVTLLFDEGEEAGLLGARAFLQSDPVAKRVDALVNLEARGVTGRAMMFETSRPNAAAIAHYRNSAQHPSANSMSTGFYRLIPNSTDVAVFDERDWTILNLAIIGNETRYHSPGDTLAALDPRSVRHMGEQAHALVRSLAAGEPKTGGGERLYADLLGRRLLVLPAWAGVGMLATLAFGIAALAWRRRPQVGRGAAVVLMSLAAAAGLAFAGQGLVGLVRGGAFWRAYPEVTSLAIDISAMLASLLAIRTLGRSLRTDALRSAYWLLFVLLGLLLGAAVPGATIFFLAPSAAYLLGTLLSRWPGGEAIGSLAGALLLFVTLGPILHLSQVLLDLDAGWIFAPLAALLALPFLIELSPGLPSLPERRIALAGAALFGTAWTAAALAPAYSEDRKQRFGVEYAWDGVTRSGRWLIVNDGATPPREAGTFSRPVEVPHSTTKRWARPAPPVSLAPPAVERLGSRPNSQGRVVSFQLSTRGAESVMVRAGPGSSLRAAGLPGSPRRFGSVKEDEHYLFRCHGRSCDGRRFELLVAGKAPLALELIGIRSGLPSEAETLLRARPNLAAPQYAPDQTLVIGRASL